MLGYITVLVSLYIVKAMWAHWAGQVEQNPPLRISKNVMM